MREFFYASISIDTINKPGNNINEHNNACECLFYRQTQLGVSKTQTSKTQTSDRNLEMW